jgi:beta-1,4-mannooligosaccharide/beta-1,4-mannosyl-N-acetylglucosamine phosphorylase
VIRCSGNPILTREDIPALSPSLADVSSVFNPGAVLFGDTYLLLLRVQTRGRETVLMVAESADGEAFNVWPEVVRIAVLEQLSEKIYHLYDPRITAIDGRYYIMLAADTDHGCRLATVVTDDFASFNLIGFDAAGDTRNGVLFPQQFAGEYLRLERPNRVVRDGQPASGNEIVLSASTDLRAWREVGPVMAGRWRYWDELIGAGPPPVKTRHGWLLIYHGVATHFAGSNIYQAGVALLDLSDPRRVLARSRENVLEPRELYELTGQVPGVVFPSGMIVDDYDADGCAEEYSSVRIYYGAGDTCVGLATATVCELLDACDPCV